MLQSNVYPDWVSKQYPLLAGMPHVAVRGLPPHAMADAVNKTQARTQAPVFFFFIVFHASAIVLKLSKGLLDSQESKVGARCISSRP